MNDLTMIGKTNWRNQNQTFGIKDQDRLQHIYCVGKTGVGKSTLLLNMAISDIRRGNGIAVIDPHGDLSKTLLHYVPKNRIKDVIYFNPADSDFPIAFNPLSDVPKDKHHLATSGIISALKRIWWDNWGPRLEHILRFSLLTLLAYGETTLLDVQPLLTNPIFRNKVLSAIDDIHLITFWRDEFEKYSPGLKAEAISPILNKLGVFKASSLLRNIIGQKANPWTMQNVMDKKKIFIANLSKGEVGEEVTTLLGSMLLTSIQLSAISRSHVPESHRVPFYAYIDEAHSFINFSLIDILSESRKFKLSLFLCHQYIDQLPDAIRSAVFGNIGTLMSFRVSNEDAFYLAKEFFPIFKEGDFINLSKYSIYIRLLIDGVASKPFSAVSMPLPYVDLSFSEEVTIQSKKLYCRPRVEIEQEIKQGSYWQTKGETVLQNGLFEN